MKGLPRSTSRGTPARQDVVKQVVKVSGELHIVYSVLDDD